MSENPGRWTCAKYVDYGDEDADRPLRVDICRTHGQPGDLPVPVGNYSVPLRVRSWPVSVSQRSRA